MAPASRQHPPHNTNKIIPFGGGSPTHAAALPPRGGLGPPPLGVYLQEAALSRCPARRSADPPHSAQTFALCRRRRRGGGSARVSAQCRRRPAGGSTEQRRGPRSPQGARFSRRGQAGRRLVRGRRRRWSGGTLPGSENETSAVTRSGAGKTLPAGRPHAPRLQPHASSRCPSSAAARPRATYPSEGAPAPLVAAAASAERSARQRN